MIDPLDIECQCEHCGKTYHPLKRARTSTYCSRECYQSARQKEAADYSMKPCEQCGKLFGPQPRTDGRPFFRMTDFRNRRFCSSKCSTDSLKLTMDQILTRLQVDPKTGCQIWTGHKSGFYGLIKWQGQNRVVHRVVWEHFRGAIPEGLQLDHTCGAKLCCNVDHLRVVTPRENSLAATSNNMAARNHRRVKCPSCGGPYSAFASGVRYCKPCRHRVQMTYQRKQRADKRKEP